MVWLAKHLRTVDIAHDMVNVSLIDYQLTVSAFHEILQQFSRCTRVHIDGMNLRSVNHAVANLGIGEVEGVLKNLHFIAYRLIVRSVIYGRLQKIVEVDLGESFVLADGIELDSANAQHETGQERGELADGP